MMDTTMMIQIGIAAATLALGGLAAFVVRRRVRWIKTRSPGTTVIDPVLNVCVRGMAAVLLLAILAWPADNDRPAGATRCQFAKESVGHDHCAWTQDGLDTASTYHN